MILTKVTDNIFMVKCKNQYQLTSTFMRLQEFYESPYENIKGKYFSVEDYMDTYAGDTGNFTYNVDWNGFNVPGDVINNFFKIFMPSDEELNRVDLLTIKEIKMWDLLYRNKVLELDKFYVIGVHDDKPNTMRHEVAHAFFYTDSNYHSKMRLQLCRITPIVYEYLKNSLSKMGYCDEVIADEIQAYLSTSSYWDLFKTFGVIITLLSNVPAFRKTFREFTD